MSKMYSVINKYLNYIVVAFIILNLLILIIIDIPIVDVVEEIFRTSSLKDILNRIFYALVLLGVFKFLYTCLHFRCERLLTELQENQNKRGLDMSELNNKAESLVQGLFGQEATTQRYGASSKMDDVSSVMANMAQEKQNTYDIANILLDKQFKLHNQATQQALREHIINISKGVDVELQKSELKSLVQVTGKSEKELLDEFPNLKLADNSDKNGSELGKDSQINNLSVLSEADSTFLLSNVICHDNVSRVFKGFGVDAENLTIEAFTTKLCKAIVKSLSKIKDDIEDREKLADVVAILHKVVVLKDELNDQQLLAFTTLVRSFDFEKNEPEPEGEPKPQESSQDQVMFLTEEEDTFVRKTIQGCKALTLECKTLQVVLEKPIDFEAIGESNLERLIFITKQQKNSNKNNPDYVRLEELLTKVISTMKA
jgi:hypothetical protein